MISLCAFVVVAFFLTTCSSQRLLLDEGCGQQSGKDDRNIVISLKSRKNETGQWFDTIVARVESPFSSDPVHLDVIHKVSECQGKRVVYLKGVTRDTSGEIQDKEIRDKFTFHPRTGSNVAISNKGFTAERINVYDAFNSAAFTSRPLKNNEIFEVTIDKRIVRWNGGIGIGVTTASPANINILSEIYKSPTVWMYYDSNVYSNGNKYLVYKAANLSVLKVGDRVGVMRTEFGVLHFFFNGVDQGPAVSNVPETVYGVVDIRYDDVKATIL